MDENELEDRVIVDDDHDEEEGAETVEVGEEKNDSAEADRVVSEIDKRTRRERQRERRRNHEDKIRQEEATRWQGQVAELNTKLAEAMERMTQASTRTSEAVERMVNPPEKPLTERARERLRNMAKQMTDKDGNPIPGAAERYLDEHVAVAEEIADARAEEKARRIVQEELARLPKPPPPEEAEYHSMAPWLREPSLFRAVKMERDRIAQIQRRDLNNPRVMDQTLKEAIRSVGKAWNRPVFGAAARGERTDPAVIGAGSRSFGGSGGDEETSGAEGMSELMKYMAKTHPVYGKIRDEGKRNAAFWSRVVVPEARKKQKSA